MIRPFYVLGENSSGNVTQKRKNYFDYVHMRAEFSYISNEDYWMQEFTEK